MVVSSSTAPAYPPSAGGSAPGVATTMLGVSGTPASVRPPTEVRTGVWGNARPSSSAVRVAPTTGARTDRDSQIGQAQSTWRRPHQVHSGSTWPASSSRVGPEQNRQRTGSRQPEQTSASR